MVEPPNIIFYPTVAEYLDQLGKQLFDKGYFGFHENALQYIQKMVDYISSYIHILSSKPAPDYFKKHGTNLKYIIYKSTKQTTWYIFFQQIDNSYLIRYITNNYVEGQYIR